MTQVRRAHPKPLPPALGTCRAQRRQDLRSPRPGGPRPVSAFLGSAPAAVSAGAQPRPPPTFGFPHGRSRRRGSGITSSPRPTLFGPAPRRAAPPPGQPGSALRTRGRPVASAHAGVRAWEAKPTPPSGFCACPRMVRRRKTAAGRTQARLLGDSAGIRRQNNCSHWRL
ncbi:translation initiation factor IF-2-like [Marmota marmota marmota]|uniref:translation initiation factor IF-2-like n=1 Tax=Marmota marmota marmota TaxID=9994 RepID=UPI002092FFCF|nr:translation initiation factor IF-2-like [Marmota marmota marmota]